MMLPIFKLAGIERMFGEFVFSVGTLSKFLSLNFLSQNDARRSKNLKRNRPTRNQLGHTVYQVTKFLKIMYRLTYFGDDYL